MSINKAKLEKAK